MNSSEDPERDIPEIPRYIWSQRRFTWDKIYILLVNLRRKLEIYDIRKNPLWNAAALLLERPKTSRKRMKRFTSPPNRWIAACLCRRLLRGYTINPTPEWILAAAAAPPGWRRARVRSHWEKACGALLWIHVTQKNSCKLNTQNCLDRTKWSA